MKLDKCTISLTDFVYSDKLESFFEELGLMEGILNIKPDWKKSSIALGRRSELDVSEFNKLDFVSNGKIILNQYQNFSTVIAITIEIELTQEILELLEKNSDFQKNTSLFESYEKQLWEFWKTKISTTVLLKRKSYLAPLSLIHFNCSTDKYKEFSLDVENAITNQRTEPVTSLLSKFGGNTEGLISILGLTDQTLSIVCQHRAIFADDGLDFSGMMFFDIKSDSWEANVTPSYYKILSFQQYRFWLTIRDEQIIFWKDRIEDLSKIIKQFEKNFSDFDENNLFSLFHEKSSFLIEYASLMDEYRYLQRIVGNQLTYSKTSWYGEQSIANEFLELNGIRYGILNGISKEIIESVEKLKGEFDIIKEQYELLGEELSELMNFVNVQQNLKLAKNNDKVQRTISRQGWITLGFTAVVVFMTWSLYDLSSNQFEIENFEPQLLYEYYNEIKITNYVISEETSFEADLTVTPRSNQFLDIRVENVTTRPFGYDGCYFKEEPNLRFGGSWLERYDPKQENITIDVFVKMTYEPYEIFYVSNNTDLSKIDVGFVDYNVSYVDVQTGKRYSTLIPSQLVVEVPIKFEDHTERCQNRYFQ